MNPEQTAKAMNDKELIAAWDDVEDGENLTPLQMAVIAEIERRQLDL
jgi:hypothetical protein